MMENYDLSFIIGPKPELGFIRAELRSDTLDPVLHPDGVAVVDFDSEFEIDRRGNRRFALDSFQLNSLHGYLQYQDVVRDVIESMMTADRLRYGADKAAPTYLWNDVRVESISLSKRSVWTTESLMDLTRAKDSPLPNLDQNHIADMAAIADRPDTSSTFTVGIDVAWDTSHGTRLLTFRDGVLVRMSTAGG